MRRSRGTLADLCRQHLQRRLVLYAVVAAMFAMGFVSGTVAVTALDGPGRQELAQYLDGFFRSLPETPPEPGTLLRDAIATDVLRTTGLMALLGLSIIGSPFVLALVFLRGFALGFSVAFLSSQQLLRGLALAVLAVLPHNLLAVPAMWVAAVAALGFAGGAGKILLGRRDGGRIGHQLAACAAGMAVSVALLAAAGFVEGYVTPVLLRQAVAMLWR